VQEKSLGLAIRKWMESMSRHLVALIMGAIIASGMARLLLYIKSLLRNS
jgi:hypothetical protein